MLAKRLTSDDPERFRDPLWSLTAKNRDFVHHYDVIDRSRLWLTVTRDFPSVADLVREKRRDAPADD
ncbi:hypothetical protein [Rathayibacter iranicus]|uniref:Uncharacterized protein n=2 Tax=Rathayibacter iranicus TaxID=59737 RepID=A0AAD1AIQ3_9MICO|nr:hypothetical protein [Rathayibacter iranicus]AZZ57176.1 hypothetical protein C7V51_15840 [Rathayibacter iranicus]MWV29811.1 hypothetical protein [Rathayibacter iranicus NCPPB 2253 = VKM Ac-1602]PPI41201.1 hypothetical protein C5E09_14705 [Rathayibacter iranicus]PPI57447.1 hypothetical protein C5E08_15595 [Rathayibacter iranicus]PPI68312.1 hypothetical protein C5E01_14645 [Rathayibacter iranicus]